MELYLPGRAQINLMYRKTLMYLVSLISLLLYNDHQTISVSVFTVIKDY